LLVLFYGIFVIIRSSFVHSIFIVVSLEVLSWSVSLVIEDVSFKYLLIQRYFILTAFLGVFFFKGLFLGVFFFKLGIPPFHLWYLGISKFLRTKVLWFFITFHKFLPLLIMRTTFVKSYVVITAIITTLVLIRSFSLFRVVLLSSSFHVIWGISLSYFSLLFTRLYWLFYSFMNLGLVASTSFYFILITTLLRVRFLLISGIPPFAFFSLKFRAVYCLLPATILVWVLLCCRVVNIIVYLRRVLRSVINTLMNLVLLITRFLTLYQVFSKTFGLKPHSWAIALALRPSYIHSEKQK
jgi:hypothetical protein